MHEAVSDILIERAREADGLSQMVLVSLFAHALLIAVVVVLPAELAFGRRRARRDADDDHALTAGPGRMRAG